MCTAADLFGEQLDVATRRQRNDLKSVAVFLDDLQRLRSDAARRSKN
jgi:hypothetical protein